MKVTGLVLTSIAALAAAQGPTEVVDAVAPPPPGTGGIKPAPPPPPPASTGAPLPGEPGGAPVVAVSPSGAGPSAGKPVPPNPAPYAGASVPVVGQAPQKCAVSCAISGLQGNNCFAKAAPPAPLVAPPKGALPPVGAVSRTVYEAVLALQDSQLPQSLPPAPAGGAELISFSPEVRNCLCSGRNGRKLRDGGARCKASGGPGCSIRDSPIPPKALVSTFLNQLCSGIKGWRPLGPRPKSPKLPKKPKMPKGLGYPPALSGGAAPAPGTPGGAPVVATSPAGPGPVGAAGAPAPGTPGGAPIAASSPASAVPAALSPPAVPVAPGSGAAVPPVPAALPPAPASSATTAA